MNYRNLSYVKSISILTSGSMLGQIIGFVGSIFMTRLYSAQEIGVMSTIVAVTGIFASVINGRFDYAIVKEQNEENVFALIKLSVLIGTITSILVSVFSYDYFAGINGFINPFLSITCVFSILIIQAFSNVFRSYNNHVGDYKTMTSVIVMRRLSEEISMILFGILSCGSIGLLVSRVIGQYFGMKREIRNIKKHFREILCVNKRRLTEVFSIHRRQLFYSTPAALMNAASYSLISLIIGSYFGLETLGVYSISFAVLGLPLSVISGNVSKVYFGEASRELSDKGNFKHITLKTLKLLCLFAVILFLVLYFLFPVFVPMIYGRKYIDSGIMIRILAPMFTIRFISSALNPGLVVANKQNLELAIQVFFVITIGLLALVCHLFEIDVDTFLTLVSLSYSLIYIVNLYYIINNSKKTSTL